MLHGAPAASPDRGGLRGCGSSRSGYSGARHHGHCDDEKRNTDQRHARAEIERGARAHPTGPARLQIAPRGAARHAKADIYPTGSVVSYNGVNYQANYPTNGDNPEVHSGAAGSGQAWLTLGSCSGAATSAAAQVAPARQDPGMAKARSLPTVE